ncbi:NTP transferase domain-containing protein [Nonomuraea candida]|uniref:NTP transferase domain-containing protein n=1 Tax=Nonomuraea candida TaxID=359159 RepID=UPI0005B9EF1D|nr:NTP transferase domain-containing protein [Nonomuraea candida]
MPSSGDAGPVPVYDAVVLAGGQARRLGGADKPGLTVGGRSLLEHVLAAVASARRTVVAGPERDLPGVVFVREDPPGGGPVPALAAGLARVTAPWVALLAGDLPFMTAAHVTALLAAARRAGGGVVLLDDEGREQWLAGAWPAAELKAALAGYPGRSLKGLLAPLVRARLRLPGRPWFDCDTMDDLEEARMNVLHEWTILACEELGIDPARVDRDQILDLTKEVAHGVARPAAPLTAYLLGLAQGAGTAPEDAVARLTTLAKNWGQATTETLTDG